MYTFERGIANSYIAGLITAVQAQAQLVELGHSTKEAEDLIRSWYPKKGRQYR